MFISLLRRLFTLIWSKWKNINGNSHARSSLSHFKLFFCAFWPRFIILWSRQLLSRNVLCKFFFRIHFSMLAVTLNWDPALNNKFQIMTPIFGFLRVCLCDFKISLSVFSLKTSVSVFVHSAAVNPLCISCLITWSGQTIASKTWTFVYFLKVAGNDNCSFYMRENTHENNSQKETNIFQRFVFTKAQRIS